MFLTCPHCGYLAALILPSQSAAQNQRAQRCPRCDGVLRVEPTDAVIPVQDDTGAHADTNADARKSRPGPSGISGEADSVGFERADDANVAVSLPGTTATPADASTASSDMRDAPAPVARRGRKHIPSFVRERPAAARLTWPWTTAIVALGLLLTLQLLLAQSHELATSARWRPWLAGLCSALPCTIPAWHEPGAFTMLSRNVQPSGTAVGVLSIEARFRNDARWPQPWPILVLSLWDVEGRQVGMRAFAPSEYRDAAAGADDTLAPGQSAGVRLQVREPTPRIVAFTFDFQ